MTKNDLACQKREIEERIATLKTRLNQVSHPEEILTLQHALEYQKGFAGLLNPSCCDNPSKNSANRFK